MLIIGAACGVCIFLITMFVFRGVQNHTLLILFFGANFIGLLDELLWSTDLVRKLPYFVNVYIPFLYVLPPTFYLYVKSLTQNLSHQKNNVIHWLGVLVGTLLCLPYFFLDENTKLERLNAPNETLEHIGIFTQGPVVALLLLLAFSCVYLFLTIKTLNQHLTNVKSYFSNIQDRDLSWVRWSVILLILAACVSFVQVLLPPSASESSMFRFFYLIFELVWLVLFGTMAIEQKPILIASASITDEPPTSAINKKKKYERSGLDSSELKRLGEKITTEIEEKQLHLDPDLTLRKLSLETKISETKLSEVLNTHFHLGFYDFVNKMRIESAVALMKSSNENLLKIAMESGFNSRSTFNLAFKRHKNSTPSQFRKNLEL